MELDEELKRIALPGKPDEELKRIATELGKLDWQKIQGRMLEAAAQRAKEKPANGSHPR